MGRRIRIDGKEKIEKKSAAPKHSVCNTRLALG